MSLLAFVVCAASGPSLNFENGSFRITQAETGSEALVPIVPVKNELQDGRFKVSVNGVLVSFDHRGLGIQYAGKGGFSGVTYAPTNVKLFSPPEIASNAALIKSGERSERVGALSGYEIIGQKVFLLLRWDDKSGKPWLEALFSIDASGDEPKTECLGKFEGMTRATGPASDELFVTQEKVAARVVGGVGLFDPGTKALTTMKFPGSPLLVVYGPSGAYTVEKSEHGTKLIIANSLTDGSRRAIFETRGEIADLGLGNAVLVTEGGVRSVFSLASGALRPLDKDTGVAQTPFGVLVWSPRTAPKSASVWEDGGWTEVASWTSKG